MAPISPIPPPPLLFSLAPGYACLAPDAQCFGLLPVANHRLGGVRDRAELERHELERHDGACRRSADGMLVYNSGDEVVRGVLGHASTALPRGVSCRIAVCVLRAHNGLLGGCSFSEFVGDTKACFWAWVTSATSQRRHSCS